MEISKPCQICKKKLAKYSCKICGNFVCEDCLSKGICINH